jgi:hypothetical protein
MLIPRTGPSLSYVLPLVPVTRPFRRSRGGSGTSSDATGGNGTRSGLEWSDRPAGLRAMTRHRPLPRGPLQSWIVRTLSGRTCSKSCQQLPGGSRWGPSLAHTPRTTRPLSCFTSLTNRSTTGPNSAYCATCTDMTVANPPALRTTTDSSVANVKPYTGPPLRTRVRDPSVVAAPSVAVRAKPTVPRTAPRPRFPSAMRPWTPQHDGQRRYEVTHNGASETARLAREFAASGAFSQVVAGVGFEPT